MDRVWLAMVVTLYPGNAAAAPAQTALGVVVRRLIWWLRISYRSDPTSNIPFMASGSAEKAASLGASTLYPNTPKAVGSPRNDERLADSREAAKLVRFAWCLITSPTVGLSGAAAVMAVVMSGAALVTSTATAKKAAAASIDG